MRWLDGITDLIDMSLRTRRLQPRRRPSTCRAPLAFQGELFEASIPVVPQKRPRGEARGKETGIPVSRTLTRFPGSEWRLSPGAGVQEGSPLPGEGTRRCQY